jgi:hypothetical protein
VHFRLPPELEALCEREQITANALIRQFIADLCDIRAWTRNSAFAGSGVAAHRAAQDYLALARRARAMKARTGAVCVDVPTHVPTSPKRAMTPLDALQQAVQREGSKTNPEEEPKP